MTTYCCCDCAYIYGPLDYVCCVLYVVCCVCSAMGNSSSTGLEMCLCLLLLNSLCILYIEYD